MKKIVLISLIFAFLGCVNGNHRKNKIKEKVHCYKVDKRSLNDRDDNNLGDLKKSPSSDNSDDFIFWYIVICNDNVYYQYSSSTPVSNFSSISWTKSDVNPVADFSKEEAFEQPESEVSPEELSPEMQQEISENPESFESTENTSDNTESDAESGADGADGADGGGGDGGGGGE